MIKLSLLLCGEKKYPSIVLSTLFIVFPIGKDVFSPEVESSPAPSSIEPQNLPVGVKQTSRTSSFEIENLLKTAEQVINGIGFAQLFTQINSNL